MRKLYWSNNYIDLNLNRCMCILFSFMSRSIW